MKRPVAVWYALFAAASFGISVPLSKILLDSVAPLLLAGLLYLGSGVGLGLMHLLRRDRDHVPHFAPGDLRWLLAAIGCGGIAAPLLLLHGLRATGGAAAALLLNLEAVFTALLAWCAFKENAGTRIVLGMVAIVAGGVVLAWPQAATAASSVRGMLAIALACFCWGLDNNFTRKVSAADPVVIAASKGLVAGSVNTALAFSLGAGLPPAGATAAALALGFGAYGVSLVLFVLAMRDLGTSRTSAYFSTAPFLGAMAAIALLHEPLTPLLAFAGALMGVGVWLHLTEHHAHEHRHTALEHAHAHLHDAHHQHTHDFDWQGEEPHTHSHRHEPLVHTHAHYPDIHHRHDH